MIGLEVALAAIILILVTIWVILDVTWTKFIALLAVLLISLAIIWTGGFELLPSIGIWLTSGRHVLDLVFALLIIGLVAFLLKRAWNNRSLGSLDLGHGLDQEHFERRCVGYLRLNGWTLTSPTTVSGMMITQAVKADAQFALMFVATHGDFGELARSVKTDRLGGLGRLVFVCYPVPQISKPVDMEQDWRAIHYPALADLEQFKF